MLNSEV